jgi:class 3 adenylate cyclase
MQHEMAKLAKIDTPQGELQLRMRVGIHTGRFLIADIGTPRRMEHVLLGTTVQQAKLAEGAGQAGRVNLSNVAYKKVKDLFRFEDGKDGYKLVVDDLSDKELDDYSVTPRRRLASSLMFERKIDQMVIEISETLRMIELLGSFIPQPVLGLLVESAATREITPVFSEPTVVFVNFIGLPEQVDQAHTTEELLQIVNSFSRAFAQINAAVEARGGMLKKVTYHLSGSDIVIYFGVPTAHTDDPSRAALAALAIRKIVTSLTAPEIGDSKPEITCQIGISKGPAFSAEIGEKRGRREFNLLGDTVNTTARIMNHAEKNQILVSGRVYESIKAKFKCVSLGDVPLKGKAAPVPIYELKPED